MEITVKDDFSKEVKLDVDPEEKLYELMPKLYRIFGIPTPCMALIHNGTDLNPSISLKEQNVNNGDELIVYFLR